mmetsp:Transcript_4297/g.4037  ORF Transcript_4297/g.4037 Transcript_4297/m.4037 type:complete len:83 (+) Transcript_4297:252-500(+)
MNMEQNQELIEKGAVSDHHVLENLQKIQPSIIPKVLHFSHSLNQKERLVKEALEKVHGQLGELHIEKELLIFAENRSSSDIS